MQKLFPKFVPPASPRELFVPPKSGFVFLHISFSKFRILVSLSFWFCFSPFCGCAQNYKNLVFASGILNRNLTRSFQFSTFSRGPKMANNPAVSDYVRQMFNKNSTTNQQQIDKPKDNTHSDSRSKCQGF